MLAEKETAKRFQQIIAIITPPEYVLAGFCFYKFPFFILSLIF